jgi:putative oxidoreductase
VSELCRSGGTPLRSTTIASVDGSRQPTQGKLDGSDLQGKRGTWWAAKEMRNSTETTDASSGPGRTGTMRVEIHMQSNYLKSQNDVVLLLSRVLFVLLYIIFGLQKLVGFSGTVTYMASTGLPVPEIAAVVSILIELGFGIAIALGWRTRPVALSLALYALVTAFIGHRYWMLRGPEQFESMINFYKNVSIAAGSLLLAVTGPGKYSLDSRRKQRKRGAEAVLN